MPAACCGWPRPWSISIGRVVLSFLQGSQADRSVLDIDDTFDAVHGGQQLRLFNAHYDEYGFQPIRVRRRRPFHHRRFRPAKRPGGKEIRAPSCVACCAPSAPNWPRTEIMLRATSLLLSRGLDFCRANGLDYILGVARPRPCASIQGLEAATKSLYEAAPKTEGAPFQGVLRRATSWSRVERIIARVEAGAEGPDTRFVVTNLKKRNARVLYEDCYCRRGQA